MTAIGPSSHPSVHEVLLFDPAGTNTTPLAEPGLGQAASGVVVMHVEGSTIFQRFRQYARLIRARRPEAIMVRSNGSVLLNFLAWLIKRFINPRALFGIVARENITASWVGRRLLAVSDFVIVPNKAILDGITRFGYSARRIFVEGSAPLSQETFAFIRRKIDQEAKSILWSDPHLRYQNPSTKHLLYALPALQKAGWDIRIWTLQTDLTQDQVEIRLLPGNHLIKSGLLQLLSYFFIANACQLGWRIVRGRPPARLTHAVGGMDLWANIASFQFVNAVWIPIQWKLGFRSWRELLQAIPPFFGFFFDYCQFHNRRCRLFLPVSDSISQEVQFRCHRHARVEVLANSFDQNRFNSSTREKWRNETRGALRIEPNSILFVFTSQGHYRRKGFWLAAEAFYLAHSQCPRAKLLIVGGKDKTLGELRSILERRFPSWREWSLFVGSQPEVERYLAASDAFLFPSYFEAFSLAEIEAAAMGLPLLLTPHHGSEMILEEGVNGRYIPFCPEGIAHCIRDFCKQPLQPVFGHGRALTVSEYAARLNEAYSYMAGC